MFRPRRGNRPWAHCDRSDEGGPETKRKAEAADLAKTPSGVGVEAALLLGRRGNESDRFLSTNSDPRPRIAALIDLPRSAEAGGHVKYWERIAGAAAEAADFPFDLTVYFSGEGGEEAL